MGGYWKLNKKVIHKWLFSCFWYLQRLSQAELRLTFALMRPGNLSFSWESYAEQSGFHRPSEHCVNPCINVFLVSTSFLSSMSCYKHWYACPETRALQLTTAWTLSFCYFYVTTNTDPIHEHYTFEKWSKHKKIWKYCRMALPPCTKSPKTLHKYNFELNSKWTWMKVLQII